MTRRLRDMDDKSTYAANSAKPNTEDDASTTSSTAPALSSDKIPQGVQRDQFGFAFEEDLLASRVYCKPLFSDSGESLVTSAARTTASSILSALSLTDVSNLSILAVPICAHEISNSDRYSFGDFQPEALEAHEEHSTSRPTKDPARANKWDAFASAVFRRRRSKLSRLEASQIPFESPEATILGVSLYESIKYANIAISLTNANGESFIYGYIPIYIAKIGVFLKEKGQSPASCLLASLTLFMIMMRSKAWFSSLRYRGAGRILCQWFSGSLAET